jgi:glycosyltransferase involved in cell wall biosynthesis
MLAPAADADGLAEALTRLLTEPAAREAFGRAARAKAEREYNDEIVARRYEALYQELISETVRSIGKVAATPN